MKVGDTVPVNLGGHVVAQARVAEMHNDRATLVIPQTVVVMAVRTELDRAPADTSGTETIVTGVDRAEAQSQETVETTNTGTAEVVNAETPAEAAPASTTETPAQVESSETAPVVEQG